MFQEEDRINATIRSLREIKKNHPLEIIVVDAKSSGSTVGAIDDPAVIRLTSEKGRAWQMNKGAAAASGDILLFLHADTTLPENGFAKITEVMESGQYVAGAFNFATESKNLFLKHIYYTSYLRSKISRIPYGDQAIFIRRDYFQKIDGFPEIPIMEDVALMKKIKKNRDKIHILKDKVKTSTRRYEEEGFIYGWLRNHRVRILYFLGVPPERLLKYYPDTRRKKQIRPGLVLFLKYPQEGKVKTRLSTDLGETLTFQLYECFIRDMLDKLEPLAYDLHLFIAPPGKVAAMKQWLERDLPVHPQQGRDLGERMKQAFKKMFQGGYESCVLMGSDLPDLPANVPAEAFESLKTSGAVIAPAADGGYYLLGFQRRHFGDAVFQNIEWSTERVFQQTLTILKQKKIPVKILPRWWDVDNVKELKALLKRNKKTGFNQSRTMKFLWEHQDEIF